MLLAYDGSDLAAFAIDQAGRQLATGRDALVVCVWQPVDVGFAPVDRRPFDATQATEVHRAAEETAAHGASLADQCGVPGPGFGGRGYADLEGDRPGSHRPQCELGRDRLPPPSWSGGPSGRECGLGGDRARRVTGPGGEPTGLNGGVVNSPNGGPLQCAASVLLGWASVVGKQDSSEQGGEESTLDGRTEQVSLECVAAQGSQLLQLILTLDTFGGAVQTECVTQFDDRTHNGVDGGILAHAGHEGLVDFQFINREPAEISE